jgi:hypothetical protein
MLNMQPQKILTFGPQMKSTFNNTVLGVECGYRQSAKIPLCGIIRPEKASVILERYDYVMASLYINEKSIHSMPNPIGN